MSLLIVDLDAACLRAPLDVYVLTAGRTPPAAEDPMISDISYGGPDPARFRIWHPLCTNLPSRKTPSR